MKFRIISTLALLGTLVLGSCSRETLPTPNPTGEGNRVVFTLAGITPETKGAVTRATGDNDQTTTTAATDAEKKVTSLLAVVYEKQASEEMGLYKVFDVTVTDGGCSFDIAKDGSYDMYLVANADEDLTAAIEALGATTPVSQLEELIVSQAPDADNAFIMTTPEAVKVISYSGEEANCGEISLRRLSVRIDILNKAEGLTINKVIFKNRAVKSQLFVPNAMIDEAGTLEDKEYADVNLVGNFNVPAEYTSKIYSYENLSKKGEASVPTLDIEYTYDGETYTHTIEFLDANDPEGLTPLALKRNYLYRITVGRKVKPEFNLEVLDWTNDESFNVDDVPFQAEMNAKLAVNNFASANVASLDEAQNKVSFVTTDPNNTSAYLAWSDKWATAVYYNETDKTYYRVPTKDEMYLLFPDVTNRLIFNEVMDGTTEVTETLPKNLFGSAEVNGGEGKSRFKNAAVAGGTGTPAYPIVYAIRFKGTAQCAAYRYEHKNSDQPNSGEVEIRIKALQPNTLLTIDEVANETYWGKPYEEDADAANQLIYHIAGTGYKATIESEDIIRPNTDSFLWTSTEVDGSTSNHAGYTISNAYVSAGIAKVNAGSLRLVKATEDEIQKGLNAVLKVNKFTPYNVRSIAGTTVTFYSELDNTVPANPKEVYFTYTELQTMNLTKSDGSEILQDANGNKYRLPTEGELNLLLPMWTEAEQRVELNADNKHYGVFHPWWNDNTTTNDPTNGSSMSYEIAPIAYTTGWIETIYLKNNDGGYPDKTTNAGSETDGDYIVSGRSWIKRGTTSVTDLAYPTNPGTRKYNLAPVYGLRFHGTSQYAAYRWESCSIDSDPQERYLSIKIKALRKDDRTTTIDDVATESFWTGDYIELKLPASGYYRGANADNPSSDNISDRGANGCYWSSSLWNDGSRARSLSFYLNDADVDHHTLDFRVPLRLVQVKE
ncbi:hypothetical protein [Millionella massiliensis]|uniref:hypothetical protein n=1 Tax=Millionella massiliensis TaxID=1871023 RepID=UPI0008D9EDCB|nr:hypothetical protein [Millionella massiliensis]